MAGTASISGLVSGMQTDTIIQKYMDLARIPEQRLQDQKSKEQQKLTAWQDLNTRVLALQTRSSAIATSSAFKTKTAASSMEDVVTANASSEATAGTYYLNVVQSAKSHQVASQTYSGLDASISQGTFTITVDNTATNIKIDSSNNSLLGIKDAINKSGANVKASIINEGTESNPAYRLVLTSNQTGTDHQMTLDSGTTGLQMNTTVQAAQDAQIKMGSLTFTRSTNSITDIIPGVTLNILNPDQTKTVKIEVNQNIESARKSVNDFVDQYNDIIKTIKDLTLYDPETGETGLLMGDYNIQQLQMDLESAVTASVPEIPFVKGQKTYNALSSIGISTGTDGLLTVNDSDLTAALQDNSADVAKLFGVGVDSDSAYISYASSSTSTQTSGAKGYQVDITQPATRATIRAGAYMDSDVLGADETLTINGKVVTLTSGWNLTQVISEINKYSNNTNVSAYAEIFGNHTYLALRALQYGSRRDITAVSSASILNSGYVPGSGLSTSGLGSVSIGVNTASGENGLGVGTAGVDVGGSINGLTCTGNGQVLIAPTDDPDSPTNGLQLLATNSAPISTNVRFIKGVGARINELLSSMTSSSGFFTVTQKNINENIDALTKDISDMEERLLSYQGQLQTQFSSMESQLSALKNQGDQLSQQLAGLSNNKS